MAGFFVDDPRYDGSVVRSLESMWENARGAREAMSSEMWGSINATHTALDVRRGRSVYAQHGFLAWVRDRAAIVSGLADAMSHDDTWRFIVLGRSLERVDLTVRVLSTRLGDAWSSAGWVATLRCCAAYESYLRTYRRGVEGAMRGSKRGRDPGSESIRRAVRRSESNTFSWLVGVTTPTCRRSKVCTTGRRHARAKFA